MRPLLTVPLVSRSAFDVGYFRPASIRSPFPFVSLLFLAPSVSRSLGPRIWPRKRLSGETRSKKSRRIQARASPPEGTRFIRESARNKRSRTGRSYFVMLTSDERRQRHAARILRASEKRRKGGGRTDGDGIRERACASCVSRDTLPITPRRSAPAPHLHSLHPFSLLISKIFFPCHGQANRSLSFSLPRASSRKRGERLRLTRYTARCASIFPREANALPARVSIYN